MPHSHVDWPAAGTPGLRIGTAAELLQITPKAIRVYHEYGLLPEPDRDASGYRRYNASALVVLGRITRLRVAGLSLRAIRPLLVADDGGAALRAALQDLDESLADEIEQRQRRRVLIEALREERIEDPLEVTAADATEERAIAVLRRMIPDVGPEEEAFERRLHRLLAAFRPPGAIDEAFTESAGDVEDDLLLATGGREAYADRFRRMFALRAADPTDPRVDALAADMRGVMRATVARPAADGGRWVTGARQSLCTGSPTMGRRPRGCAARAAARGPPHLGTRLHRHVHRSLRDQGSRREEPRSWRRVGPDSHAAVGPSFRRAAYSRRLGRAGFGAVSQALLTLTMGEAAHLGECPVDQGAASGFDEHRRVLQAVSAGSVTDRRWRRHDQSARRGARYCQDPRAGPRSGAAQMAFEVEDLDQAVADLRARGLEFATFDMAGFEVTDQIVVAPDNYPSKGTGERGTFFFDSEGNLLRLAQATR